MSKKLNKKLVFVVGSLVLILGVVGMISLVMVQGNTERHIRAGDEFMEAKEYRKAADTYGRAVAKKATNLDYLAKFKGAILMITPETENEARERYQQYLAVLESESRAGRDDLGRWRNSMEAFRTQAEAFDSTVVWNMLAERSENMLRTVPEEGAGAAIAKLYRGYAGFRRIDSLNDTERTAVLADLEAALKSSELTPVERDLGVGSLARLAVRDRARAATAGRADRVEAAQAAMDAAFKRAETETPDGLRTRIAFFERALFLGQGKASDEGVAANGERLVAAAEQCEDQMAILEIGQVLLRGGAFGLEESQALLASYVAKHPEQLLHRRALATTLRASDRQTARRELQAVLDAPRPTTGLLSSLYESNRLAASSALFDIAFDDADAASEAERPALIEQASKARDALAASLAGMADNSMILRADGKLALLKQDPMGAIIKFNEVFRKGSAVDLELYILTALSNMRIQETGRALELVNGGLGLAPGNVQLLKLRARLELASARSTDALNTLRGIIEVFPDDVEAKDLLALATNAQRNDVANTAVGGATDEFVELAARIQLAAEAKEFDQARRLIQDARTKAGAPDVRIERVAIAVEVQANDLDAARKLTRDALANFPSDAALVRFNAVLASEDIVERVIAFAEGAVEDPKERTVLTFLRLLQTGEGLRETAERERRLGLASAAKTAENAARLENAAKEWRSKAEAADRAHPALLEVDFLKALKDKDYSACEALAKIADDSGRDRTQGTIFRARAFLEQERLQEAAQVLERAIQAGVDASTIYRTLGSALERLGNIEGALRNYEESYKRRPADMGTVRLLVGALVRSGNLPRALEVLRQARSLAGFDDDVGNTWLLLEQQVGDRRMAQRMRENRYRLAPTDIENASAYASILALSAPGREDIVTEAGKQVFTENQWNGMDAATRLRELDRIRTTWRERAEAVYGEIMARDPGNIDAANAYANMLRLLGRPADAERALATAVEKAGTAAGWRGFVLLGQMQCYLQAEDRAKASFAKAIEREDGATRPATRVIVDTLIGIERYELALTYLEPLAQADPSQGMKMRLAECLLRLNRAADARKVYDAAAGSGSRDVGSELLDGAISVAVGDELQTKGDNAGAQAAYERAIAPYQRAKQAAPAIPQPFIQDAMLKRKLFELTGDRARGQEALAAADRATLVGATFFPACAARSEVLVVLGDLTGAAAELDRYLRLMPTNVEARRRLVDLLYTNNQLDRAEESLREAIGYAPGEPAWHYTLGELLARRGRMPEAAASFARADKLRPDAMTFFRELDARIRAKDLRGAIDACRARGELMRESPVARAYLGAALVAIGEKGDGVATLRESFALVKKDYDAGNAQPMQDWYGAIRLIFAPALLNEAEALVKEVSGGDPTAVGWDYLSFLALGTDLGGPARVISYLEPIASRDYTAMPEFGAIFFDRLGTSYYLVGRCSDALRTFEKALALTPNNHAVLNNYAYLCVECEKDPKKATVPARRAVQLQPARGEYLDTLAYVLVSDGQWQEGLDYADRAAKIADSAPVQLHRAMALKGLRRDAEARDALRRASEMNPDPPTKKSIDELKAALN